MEFTDEIKRNFFYHQIVENDEDFVGCVAYILYKKNKIDYIETYKRDNGSAPTDDVLHEWQKNECTQSKLQNYKDSANQRISKFVNALVEEKNKELKRKQEAIRKQETNLRKREEKVKQREVAADMRDKELSTRDRTCHVKRDEHGFMYGVWQSLLASFIFLVICFFIYKYLIGHTEVLNLIKQ